VSFVVAFLLKFFRIKIPKPLFSAPDDKISAKSIIQNNCFNDDGLKNNFNKPPKENCGQKSNDDILSGLERPLAAEVDIPLLWAI
jgi:hypothetical protein